MDEAVRTQSLLERSAAEGDSPVCVRGAGKHGGRGVELLGSAAQRVVNGIEG